MRRNLAILGLVGSGLLATGTAGAATVACDLTSDTRAGATECDVTGVTASGAAVDIKIQIPIEENSVGTGTISAFNTTQGTGSPNGETGTVESGFNTDYAPAPLDSKRVGGAGDKGFTRSVTLGALPIVKDGDALFYELLLDINQFSSSPNLSLDALRFFMGRGTGNLADAYSITPTGNDTTGFVKQGSTALDLIWSLDRPAIGQTAAVNQSLLFDYRLCGDKAVDNDPFADCKSGSGKGYDLRFLLPTSLFSGYLDSDYFVLYSSYGWYGCDSIAAAGTGGSKKKNNAKQEATTERCFGRNDGFEEWAFRTDAVDYCVANPRDPLCDQKEVPEPGSLFLVVMGLLGFGFSRRIKFNPRHATCVAQL